jgi:hypothetical protein
MNEMDVSIDQVQSNANETARLSEEVALDAERGAEAILKTIGEIYRIKESSQEAVAVISNLGFRIEAIGQILAGHRRRRRADQPARAERRHHRRAGRRARQGLRGRRRRDQRSRRARRRQHQGDRRADQDHPGRVEERHHRRRARRAQRRSRRRGLQRGRARPEEDPRELAEVDQHGARHRPRDGRAGQGLEAGDRRDRAHRRDGAADRRGHRPAGARLRADHEERREDADHHPARRALEPGAGARRPQITAPSSRSPTWSTALNASQRSQRRSGELLVDGRARRRGDLGDGDRGHRGRPREVQPLGLRGARHRHHQPARDHAALDRATGRPLGRAGTAPSSGKTAAPPRSATRSGRGASRRSSTSAPGCCSTRTSRAPRSRGCSTTSTARGPRRCAASWPSAPSTPGWSTS